MNNPAKRQRRYSEFVREGLFVAMPLRFPSVSTGIADDNAFVAHLAEGPGGGRSMLGICHGAEQHLFAAVLTAPTGYVVDLGCIDEADELTTVGWRETDLHIPHLFAGGRIDDDGALWAGKGYFFADGIQEWGLNRPLFGRVQTFPGEPVRDAVALEDGVLCLTDWAVYLLDAEMGEVKARQPFQCVRCMRGARLMPCGDRRVLLDDAGRVHEILASQSAELQIVPHDVQLPAMDLPTIVTTHRGEHELIVGDGQGMIVTANLDARTVCEHDPAPLAPVHCLAALPDGRIYGFCGDEIGRLFRTCALSCETTDLDVVATVYGARRYAYCMACALTNPDGHIVFGEYDRGGHLWIYCPPLG